MTIGLPREIKSQEHRVALLPSAAYQLIKRGHSVVAEKGAGAGAGYPDTDYEQAGVTMVDSHRAVFERADLVVKVKEPLPEEFPLRPGYEEPVEFAVPNTFGDQEEPIDLTLGGSQQPGVLVDFGSERPRRTVESGTKNGPKRPLRTVESGRECG